MSDRPTAEQTDVQPEDEAAIRRGAAGSEQAGDEGDLPQPVGGTAPDEDVAHGTATEDATEDAPAAVEELGDEEQDGRNAEELLTALRAAERERDEYLDSLRRSQAEFQNYRKRAMREGAQQREQGATDVLARLVEVVDDFELAVIAADSAQDVQSLRKGVEMVYGKLVDVLRSFGMEKIGQEGVPFDPERHDAVQQVDDGEHREEPIVVEVLRPGYMVGDRVLRPAMVKVAR